MDKMLNVKKVNEDLINKITNETKYAILYDKAAGNEFHNMVKAINLFAQNGWRCVNISVARYGERLGEDHLIYALLEKGT